MGAWIETREPMASELCKAVAPHVGAWIETDGFDIDMSKTYGSHPMWVRGLKLAYQKIINDHYKSHPMWVRGLKPKAQYGEESAARSHPMWVRGLKHLIT